MSDGSKKLEEVEILRLELCKAEIALHAEAILRRGLQGEMAERDALLRALEARNGRKLIELKKAEAQSKLESLLATLSEKYDVDLTTSTYDDETGIIYEHEEKRDGDT